MRLRGAIGARTRQERVRARLTLILKLRSFRKQGFGAMQLPPGPPKGGAAVALKPYSGTSGLGVAKAAESQLQ